MCELLIEEAGLVRHPRGVIPGGGPQTVGELLDRAVQGFAGREALVSRDRRMRYAELGQEVARAARVMEKLGIGPGDRVAACLPNQPQLVVAFLAAMRLGAVWVGVNRNLAWEEKRFVLEDSRTNMLLTEAPVASQARTVMPALRNLAQVIEVGTEEEPAEWENLLLEAASGVSPTDAPRLDPGAPAVIAYTSGTTGFPKGVVHSQRNLLLPGAVLTSRVRAYGSEMRNGVMLPLTIVNAMILQILVAFRTGAAIILIDRIDPEGLREWIVDERITVFMTVPAIMHDLLSHPKLTQEDLATVVVPGVGGAHTPEALKALYREWFGRNLTTGYGLTEAPTAVTQQPPGPPVPHSSGQALPQVTLQIVDDDDVTLPPGQVGEICVGPSKHGPWAHAYTPMLGYWQRPQDTAAALRGGRLHTGDMGHLDEHGNLFVQDRRSDLILRGGANVYPAEVERVLVEHPAVAAAAVVGRPHARLGEEVIAFVEIEEGGHTTPAALLDYCREHLARYKAPAEVIALTEMPRNSMGKLLKGELKEQLTRVELEGGQS